MHKHNTLNYIEFPAPDLAAVKKFYGDAFGWKFTDFGPSYTSFKLEDAGLDGGFTEGKVAGECGPLIILYSEDLAASQKKVEECGGKIVKPIFAFPGGKRFHFTDPAGNCLSVWSDK
jgi:uncharacterized protein